ncbi:ligase-associated DNA damage response DEXH box helicase [Flammeovirgaceae bacterium SG7u.111]|nr:ligase-associated DNA damage response DEXH box helicase [Flammeovirgaceae bacterium SG7u.132]WPO36039.1 ligase-associated DNA damage response DEXH box helicase [Flammeovirgaceae bacterium SG7u.111]
MEKKNTAISDNFLGIGQIETWFAQKDWKPFPFQLEAWQAYLRGENGILNAPTGSGKTYGLWLGCLAEYFNNITKNKQPKGLQVIWITPLRALAKDIQRAMQEACEGLGVPWEVGIRSGDTTAATKRLQKKQMPHCLITTPESLHVLLAQKGYPSLFQELKTVIVDEWHELLGSKRGIQAELGISRLKALQPKLRVWGISATIGNLQQAGEVLCGNGFYTVKAKVQKKIEAVSILPDTVEKFPWTGHLGLNLIDKVLPIVEKSTSTLLFTNTRAQTEIWYQTLLAKAPWLAGQLAMHHGSLDPAIRMWVEDAIHEGKLKLVACTSSLDLGVDFRPVETVIQIGGPKGVNRFLQRAGRSGHRPDAVSKIYFMPTHSLELMEGAALSQAVREVTQEDNVTHLESRFPLQKPMDVLVQYMVTLAVSDGFEAKQLWQEVKSTYAYRELSREEWEWALAFITTGGNSLGAYDEFSKVVVENGLYKVTSRKVAIRHRLSMGTIVSEPMIKVRFVTGGYIGTVEEYFISKLNPGDVFWFAGRNLEFVKMDKLTAKVKKSNKKKGQVPRWMGARMPLSSELAGLIREKLDAFRTSIDIEMQTIRPMLELQHRWSLVPAKNQFLIEKIRSDEGYHVFFYPFEGRMVHEIMAAMVCFRISQMLPISLTFAMNDYGFEILSDIEIPLEDALESDLFSTENLLFDIESSLNETEMAKRRFREIATIAGLVFRGYPGKSKKARHLQASTQLLFDVFSEYDSENLLIKQAFQEVIDMQLEHGRLEKAMDKIKTMHIKVTNPPKFTPFAFPIMVDRRRDSLSSESFESRIQKMQVQLEQFAEEEI